MMVINMADSVDDITRRVSRTVEGMFVKPTGGSMYSTRVETNQKVHDVTWRDSQKESQDLEKLREIINRERIQFRDELDRASLDWRDQLRTLKKDYDSEIQSLKKELKLSEEAQMIAEDKYKTVKSILDRTASELDEKTRGAILQGVESERRRWSDERNQMFSDMMQRESEWRIISESAAESERLRLSSDDQIRNLQAELSEEQRKVKERERVIDVARSEMEKFANRANSEFSIKENEMATLKKECMSLRVALEELDKRRRIELDHITKRAEIERQDFNQLIEYYKKRVEDQDKTITELRRSVSNEISRVPVTFTQNHTEQGSTFNQQTVDENFFKSFNKSTAWRQGLQVEDHLETSDIQLRPIEKLVPNTSQLTYSTTPLPPPPVENQGQTTDRQQQSERSHKYSNFSFKG